MRIEREQHFDVPLPRAFAYITDPASWPEYWPGLVRVEPGTRWQAPGDEARVVVRLLGRQVELRMLLRRFERNRLVEYESVQAGLPDARHERQFEAEANGFVYRLAVECRPRPGLRGVYDRLVVRRGIARALRLTVENLDGALAQMPTTPPAG